MIISVVAAKIWYLKNVRFLLGQPVVSCNVVLCKMTQLLTTLANANDGFQI